jgi:Spy/CpxP family protein refolding chaperone
MKFIVFSVLMAISLGVNAQQTNAPAPRPQPQKNPANLSSQDLAGMAIGGPVGVLTDQQRAFYFAAMKNERARLAELQSKLAAARQEVLVTSVTGKFDENLVRQKALVSARIEAEMAVVRAKVFSQVQPPLTPEQIEKIKTGQPGPMRPLNAQQNERLLQRAPTGSANQDSNGLPPKK